MKTAPQLQEIIARHRPGDKVNIKVHRNGREKELTVTLRNREGQTEFLAKNKSEILNILGAEFEALDKETAEKLDIHGGVKVTKLYAGKLMRETDIREGFIITKVDGKKVGSVEELSKALEKKTGGILLEGVYENIPGKYYYAFGLES